MTLALGLEFKCFQGAEKVNFLLQGSAQLGLFISLILDSFGREGKLNVS